MLFNWLVQFPLHLAGNVFIYSLASLISDALFQEGRKIRTKIFFHISKASLLARSVTKDLAAEIS